MEKALKKTKNMPKEWYEKYRWFYTSNKHLVIGGKNAEQNEELVKKFLKTNPKYVVMHTKDPGSPFSIIVADNPTEKDLEETAIFTGSFSRAWRDGKKKASVDVFLMEQIVKMKNMKSGTFGVIEKVDRKSLELKLYLTIQKERARFVPQKPLKEQTICIVPGKMPKDQIAEELAVKLEITKEEILNALPTGGSKICK
ncbi:MAG: NFACT RNA binding domain-containing protein [Nanoarchaeota archaeon]